MQMDAGYAAFSATDTEGKYTLEWRRDGKTWSEIPVGNYKVLIQLHAGQDVEDLDAEAMLDGKDAAIQNKGPEFPEKYRQHSTSGLEYTVKEGANEDANFELSTK